MAIKRLTTEIFIERAKAKHGIDRYDYSATNYTHCNNKIIIKCLIHNLIFETYPHNHLRGNGGCPLCATEGRSLSWQSFLEKSIEAHGQNRYDYSYAKKEYKGTKSKITIICKKCGHRFVQLPSNHIKGHGCINCVNLAKSFDKNFFIKEAEKKHGIGRYDYSKIKYKNSYTPIYIICNKCNKKFYQQPRIHLKGIGCSHCYYKSKTLTKEEFIKRAEEIHEKGKYDYSNVEYIQSNIKIKIKCNKCNNIFWQYPHEHLKAKGCRICAIKDITDTKETFIKKAKKVHKDFYDYSSIKYINSQTLIYINCPKHGFFAQRPNAHLRGHGCPNCALAAQRSRGEIELGEFIKSIYSNKILKNSKTQLGNKMELDIYLPELKLAIEYNGDYWHNLKEAKHPGCHEDKRNRCKERGIKLIEVLDTEWQKNKDQIKESLKKQIGELIKISTKIKSG